MSTCRPLHSQWNLHRVHCHSRDFRRNEVCPRQLVGARDIPGDGRDKSTFVISKAPVSNQMSCGDCLILVLGPRFVAWLEMRQRKYLEMRPLHRIRCTFLERVARIGRGRGKDGDQGWQSTPSLVRSPQTLRIKSREKLSRSTRPRRTNLDAGTQHQ